MERVSATAGISRFWKIAEVRYPLASGVAASACSLAWIDKLFRHGADAGWEMGEIYLTVFSLSTVFTAFLFTFFAQVITTDHGFIASMRRTQAYAAMRRYTIEALIVGGALTVVTIPLTVVQPTVLSPLGAGHIVVALWIGLTVWSMLAFCRSTQFFIGFIKHYR